MAAQTTERRLAAIFVADVVGYSRLMSEREEATLANLRACLKVFNDHIENHGGRIFGGAGDSVVAEFPSAVEAVRAAAEIQQALAQRNGEVATEDCMQFRIGISVGDVIVEGDNLMGEGVNIAARLESLAEHGGINITGHVYHQVRNKVEAGFVDAGRQTLKNIPTPVQVYRVVADPSVVPALSKGSSATGAFSRWRAAAAGIAVLAAVAVIWTVTQREPAVPPDETPAATRPAEKQDKKPSIAVLPFANMSGDPEQEYFVDGITEDIITDFSRLSNLTVIAWSTTSNYKGKKVQPQQVGKELGVKYVLDGSVRKAGDRLRITAQLVDTANSKQLWAERYDRKLADVFALQDDVTKKIVATLAIRLTAAEKSKLGQSGTNNFDAYDAFLRGQQLSRQRTRETNALTREAYRRAIELDPTFARPYGALAVTRTFDLRRGWTDLSPDDALARALDLAQKAVALDPSSPQAYWALGFVQLFRQDYDAAAAAAEQAVTLAPNYADGYGLLALIYNFLGKAEDALKYIRKAMVLNPNYTYDYPWNMGLAYHTLGRYDEAAEQFRTALTRNENAFAPRVYLVSSYVRLGRLEDAEWEIEQIMVQNPDTSLSQYAESYPMKDKERKDALLDDLRKAGMPE